MREIGMIVTKEEQLKNPAVVYSVIIQWMREAGEDFIDYNDSLIKGKDILGWMLNKGMITKDKHDKVIENNEVWIQDLLFGYETGVLAYGECDFPSNSKAYQIISEYISESKELREQIVYRLCTSFDSDNGDEIRGGMSGSYDAEDGLPICSHIFDYDLQTNTMTKEEWLEQKGYADISFIDEYSYLKEMTLEESDKLSEELN